VCREGSGSRGMHQRGARQQDFISALEGSPERLSKGVSLTLNNLYAGAKDARNERRKVPENSEKILMGRKRHYSTKNCSGPACDAKSSENCGGFYKLYRKSA